MPAAKVDYTDTPAPFSEEDQQMQAQYAALSDEGAAGLQKAIKAGRVVDMEDEEDEGPLRAFAAPKEPNTKFMVHAGRVVSFRAENSPLGKRDIERDGDIWAQFAGGICATRDPFVIAWCEAHAGDPELHLAYHQEVGSKARDCGVEVGLCRDVDDESTGEWAEMKILQIATARRAQQLPSNMDIDKLFRRIKGTGVHLGGGTETETMENAVTAARNADRERTKGR